jgi:hypothetical protein
MMIKNKFVMKNSTGDLTSPHAKVDEKFAGSTRGPDKNKEGKPTININTLKVARYRTTNSSLRVLCLILW